MTVANTDSYYNTGNYLFGTFLEHPLNKIVFDTGNGGRPFQKEQPTLALKANFHVPNYGKLPCLGLTSMA
jgi:hypothetical protein